ncbi:MAG: hypothetical protein C4B58_00955 [Deltaproteobacteria bacterium]|nr:MAG: hypothetical protein C4B58_00955 [Deltaproteobacteria bacterium]
MATYLSPGVYTREIDFSYYVKQISTSSCGMVGVAERGPINKPVLVTSWEQFINKFGSYLQAGYLAYAARAFFDNGGSVLYVNRIAHLTDPTDKSSLTAVKSSVTLKDRRAVAAMLETGTAGTDRITWLARQAGVDGNGISVELVASGTDTPLSVDVTGQAITVNLATDSAGDPAAIADQVVVAIAEKPEADALVQATTEDTGIVQPATSANLAGGQDAQDTLRALAINEGVWGDRLSVQIEDGTLDPATGFNLVIRYKDEVVEVFKDLSMDESASNHVELAINERSEFISVEDLGPLSGTPDDRPATGGFSLSGGDDGLVNLNDIDYIGDPSQHVTIHTPPPTPLTY